MVFRNYWQNSGQWSSGFFCTRPKTVNHVGVATHSVPLAVHQPSKSLQTCMITSTDFRLKFTNTYSSFGVYCILNASLISIGVCDPSEGSRDSRLRNLCSRACLLLIGKHEICCWHAHIVSSLIYIDRVCMFALSLTRLCEMDGRAEESLPSYKLVHFWLFKHIYIYRNCSEYHQQTSFQHTNWCIHC